ncbi:hypothetical protein GCM10020000_81030 [Streptomyces olivoverticillatus]
MAPGDKQEQGALAADGVAQSRARHFQHGFPHDATTDLLVGQALDGHVPIVPRRLSSVEWERFA